jgi:hypothetical protein
LAADWTAPARCISVTEFNRTRSEFSISVHPAGGVSSFENARRSVDLSRIAGYAEFDEDMASAVEFANTPDTGKRPIRLGVGDYTRRGSDLASHFAQRPFIEHLDAEAPRVREALRSLLGLGEGRELDAEIDRWARTYRLLWNGKPPRWIRQTARATLRWWSLSPDATGWRYAVAADWGVLAEKDCRILIDTSWDPSDVENEEVAIQRISADVREQISLIKQRAEAAGGSKTQEKREPEHFGWLVRYIVNKEPPESISASGRPYSVGARSVKQALRETAALLPLTLPPFPATVKRGRPSKIA